MSSEIVPRQRYWTGATNEDYERLPVALTRHKTHDVLCQGLLAKSARNPWLIWSDLSNRAARAAFDFDFAFSLDELLSFCFLLVQPSRRPRGMQRR